MGAFGEVRLAMRRQCDDQPKLPIEVPDARRRRRRSRRRHYSRPVRTGQRELLSRPLVQTCGFCGHRQTVFEEARVCERCGGVMVKGDPEEEEW